MKPRLSLAKKSIFLVVFCAVQKYSPHFPGIKSAQYEVVWSTLHGVVLTGHFPYFPGHLKHSHGKPSGNSGIHWILCCWSAMIGTRSSSTWARERFSRIRTNARSTPAPTTSRAPTTIPAMRNPRAVV